MTTVRIVIADDERPARAYVRALLDECEGVIVVGEAVNGTDAVTLIEREAPDLALLDLQMPELDGIEVVRMLPPERVPMVAFITAYDAYAVQAFEVNAVDYLLKPVDVNRLRETIARARGRMEQHETQRAAQPDMATRIAAVAEDIQRDETRPLLRRIPVRRRDDIFFVMVDEIASVVADGEILHLTTRKGDRYVITYTLRELESRLDEKQFVRLSRSALVNLDTIAKVSPMLGGTYVVELVTRQIIPVSRQRSRVLRETVLRL